MICTSFGLPFFPLKYGQKTLGKVPVKLVHKYYDLKNNKKNVLTDLMIICSEKTRNKNM